MRCISRARTILEQLSLISGVIFFPRGELLRHNEKEP